ncbi:MAG: M56 family metallopeptidase [Bacteroidota bacterium]|nr:M56 family metallopeptidase [Bacteroidota bacterium]
MQLLFLHPIFSEEVERAIVWTLIHSLWQGLLAAVLAGIIIALTRRSSARTRYNLLALVMLLFLVSTLVTFSLQNKNNAGIKPVAGLNSIATPIFPVNTQYEITAVKAPAAVDELVTYFNTHADFIVLAWAVFFLIHCIKLFTGLAGIQRLRTFKTHSPIKEWQEKLDYLAIALDIPGSIRLLESELVKIPAAIGYFKPVILVPLGLLSNLPAGQVEAILLHELAHIRRKDYIMNILQRFTEAVFFFNPALLWISSLIRQEREACCDDVVVANTHHKGSYLDALVSFQEYSMTASGYAMGISSKKHYLLNRVKRILTRENKKLNLMEKILLIAGLAVVTAFTFIPKEETGKLVAKESATPEVTQRKGGVAVSQALSRSPVLQAKQAVKKEKNKPALTNLPGAPLADTVPVSPMKNEKTGYDDIKFQGISHHLDDDGKTRTENIEVTTEDGKTYKISKLNNKITSLIIDGKSIPEGDTDNYKPLIEKIYFAIEENRARRLEERKADMLRRQEDRKRMMAERQWENEMNNKERMKQREEESKYMDMQRKVLEDQKQQMRKEVEKNNGKSEEYRKQIIMERKMLEDQRKQLTNEGDAKREEFRKQLNLERKIRENENRQLIRKAERLRKQRVYLDSNGREIIKHDSRTNNDDKIADVREKAGAVNKAEKNFIIYQGDFKNEFVVNTRVYPDINNKAVNYFKCENLFKGNPQKLYPPKYGLANQLFKVSPGARFSKEAPPVPPKTPAKIVSKKRVMA